MTVNPVKSILNKLKNNEISADEAEKLLLNNLSESIGSATIDHARSIFKEFPEVIFAKGKKLPAQRSIRFRNRPATPKPRGTTLAAASNQKGISPKSLGSRNNWSHFCLTR